MRYILLLMCFAFKALAFEITVTDQTIEFTVFENEGGETEHVCQLYPTPSPPKFYLLYGDIHDIMEQLQNNLDCKDLANKRLAVYKVKNGIRQEIAFPKDMAENLKDLLLISGKARGSCSSFASFCVLRNGGGFGKLLGKGRLDQYVSLYAKGQLPDQLKIPGTTFIMTLPEDETKTGESRYYDSHFVISLGDGHFISKLGCGGDVEFSTLEQLRMKYPENDYIGILDIDGIKKELIKKK